MPLQFRRGSDAQLSSITPLAGEPIWTTDTRKLYVGDGVTPGGWPAGGYTGSLGYTGSQGVPGQSSNYYRYNAKVSSTSGNPGNTFLIWNNSTQRLATQINVSHLDRDNNDIDVFLALLNTDDTLIIQDQNDSNNYQTWTVSNTPTVIPNSYVQVPVTAVSSTGTGYTNFSGGHDLLFIIQSAGVQGPIGYTGSASTVAGATGYTGSAGAGYTGSAGAFNQSLNTTDSVQFASVTATNSVIIGTNTIQPCGSIGGLAFSAAAKIPNLYTGAIDKAAGGNNFIESGATIQPSTAVPNAVDLGKDNNKWRYVYANTASINVLRFADGTTASSITQMTGYTGSSGAGTTGYTGSAGTNGTNGTNGYTGSASTVAGPTGPQGPQGAIGYTGSAGSFNQSLNTSDRVTFDVITATTKIVVGTPSTSTNTFGITVGTTDGIKLPVGTTAQRPNMPVDGLMRYNTTTGKLEIWSNGVWNNITLTAAGYGLQYLIVGGGGGGGGYVGGGAGAGGVTTGTISVSTLSQTYNILIGAGGAGGCGGLAGAKGTRSAFTTTFFGTLASCGGGGGGPGTAASTATISGASGGGGGRTCSYTGPAGAGIAGQGFAGGKGVGPSSGVQGSGGGGGGGASVVGGVAVSGTRGGNGGSGVVSSITGTNFTYAGGGGGGGFGGPLAPSMAGGAGGAGGGGAGKATDGTSNPGTANLGGGGGAAGYINGSGGNVGGAGGSGVVYLAYPATSQIGSGGQSTSTYVGNCGSTFYVHKFTSSGNFIF